MSGEHDGGVLGLIAEVRQLGGEVPRRAVNGDLERGVARRGRLRGRGEQLRILQDDGLQAREERLDRDDERLHRLAVLSWCIPYARIVHLGHQLNARRCLRQLSLHIQ